MPCGFLPPLARQPAALTQGRNPQASSARGFPFGRFGPAAVTRNPAFLGGISVRERRRRHDMHRPHAAYREFPSTSNRGASNRSALHCECQVGAHLSEGKFFRVAEPGLLPTRHRLRRQHYSPTRAYNDTRRRDLAGDFLLIAGGASNDRGRARLKRKTGIPNSAS